MKTIDNAANAIKNIQAEYSDRVIKGWEMPTLIDTNTLEDIGFAVIVYLASKCQYTDKLLEDWKNKLCADEYSISAKRNQLQVKYTIRY